MLRFWGAKPKAGTGVPVDERAPYHDLRLGDVVVDPYWIERFERWMETRGKSAQTRNHYRSTMSMLFKVAAEPTYRGHTGISSNPFAGVPRERTIGRKATIAPDELRRWLAAASYHVRLAVAIGALCPKLRLGSILALTWRDNVDLDRGLITTWTHKTVASTGRPQVAPIPGQLLGILQDARRRFPHATHVVTYRGGPLKSITDGVKLSLERAGLPRGRAHGLTFHSLRHTATTMLRRQHVPLAEAKSIMGHERLETTLWYDHVLVEDEVAPTENLSLALPIADLVTAPRLRAKGKKG